jgi:hypothetical protein
MPTLRVWIESNSLDFEKFSGEYWNKRYCIHSRGYGDLGFSIYNLEGCTGMCDYVVIITRAKILREVRLS